MYLTVVGLVQIFVCEKKMRNQNKAYLLTARPFKNVSFLNVAGMSILIYRNIIVQ